MPLLSVTLYRLRRLRMSLGACDYGLRKEKAWKGRLRC